MHTTEIRLAAEIYKVLNRKYEKVLLDANDFITFFSNRKNIDSKTRLQIENDIFYINNLVKKIFWDSRLRARIYNHLGCLNLAIGKLDKAIECFQSSCKEYDEMLGWTYMPPLVRDFFSVFKVQELYPGYIAKQQLSNIYFTEAKPQINLSPDSNSLADSFLNSLRELEFELKQLIRKKSKAAIKNSNQPSPLPSIHKEIIDNKQSTVQSSPAVLSKQTQFFTTLPISDKKPSEEAKERSTTVNENIEGADDGWVLVNGM